LVRALVHIAGCLAALVVLHVAGAQTLVRPEIMGDGIPESLTGAPGDATRGRALVLDRSTTCILCHSGPFGTQFQGDLAPSLAGAGNRWSASQLRLRLVDAAHFNPDTIMPSYYRTGGFARVGRNWTGKSILSADQIEDIVAYLATLRD
jgi:L-cysteine S-thiosulfotransferase